MLAACLLLICAIAGGTLLTFLFDQAAPRAARLCMGTGIGLVLLAGIGFVFSLGSGLGAASLGASTTGVMLPCLLLMHSGIRGRVAAQFIRRGRRNGRGPKWNAAYVIFYAALALLLALVFNRAVFQRPDGIYTGVVNNLGDLPLHFQIINSFAQGGNIPPQDPTYAGVRFAYPFMVDFLAAMLVRAGASVIGAMWLENMVLGLALIGSLHYWTLLLTRDRRAGFIAPLLMIFSGGFGWWQMLADLRSSDGLFSLLSSLPHDYTILSAPNSLLRWGNSLTTLFVPQRSILFGLPPAIFVFCQWWSVVHEPEATAAKDIPAKSSSREEKRMRAEARRGKRREQGPTDPGPPFPWWRRMTAAGIMAGLLPLVHAHTFLVVMASAVYLALVFYRIWRRWALFVAIAIFVSLPEGLWLSRTGGVNMQSYLAWQPGWDHGDHNVLWFWLVNTGLFIPLLVAALLARGEKFALPGNVLRFYLPFALCFVIPNLVRLAPWIWDNIKVLFVWYLASTPLVALLLAKWWKQETRWRWLAPGALFVLLLAGGLDVLRVISNAGEYREFDPEEIAVGKAISTGAAADAVVLHAPIYNSPVFLTGRRSLLGYPGWMWSRGLDYSRRSNEIQRIYEGGPDAPVLLRQYNVDYALLGPPELASFRVNEQFWSRFNTVAQYGSYRLYKIDYEDVK